MAVVGAPVMKCEGWGMLGIICCAWGTTCGATSKWIPGTVEERRRTLINHADKIVNILISFSFKWIWCLMNIINYYHYQPVANLRISIFLLQYGRDGKQFCSEKAVYISNMLPIWGFYSNWKLKIPIFFKSAKYRQWISNCHSYVHINELF